MGNIKESIYTVKRYIIEEFEITARNNAHAKILAASAYDPIKITVTKETIKIKK